MKMNVTSNLISINQNSFRVNRQLKNGIFYHGVEVHKHTDVSINCLCFELDVLGCVKSWLKLAKYEITKTLTIN